MGFVTEKENFILDSQGKTERQLTLPRMAPILLPVQQQQQARLEASTGKETLQIEWKN